MKDFEISLLADYYGRLLSKRAYRMVSLYYDEDLTLAEIADEFGISRQGVHTNIEKSVRALAGFERKLGLIARAREAEELAREGAAASELLRLFLPRNAE